MSTPHFLDGLGVLSTKGAELDRPTADHMFGKILGLLFVQDLSSSQLVAFLHHTQQFYNRVNGVENKQFTNKRAHNVEILVVPSASCDPASLQKWMNDLGSPFLQVTQYILSVGTRTFKLTSRAFLAHCLTCRLPLSRHSYLQTILDLLLSTIPQSWHSSLLSRLTR